MIKKIAIPTPPELAVFVGRKFRWVYPAKAVGTITAIRCFEEKDEEYDYKQKIAILDFNGEPYGLLNLEDTKKYLEKMLSKFGI